MNNMEREKLVEQYLNGGLNGSQEQDFFIKVAVDNELRRTLRAYMIVDTAFRADRDAVASERPAVRARIMSALEASSVSQPVTTGTLSQGSGVAGSAVSISKWSLPIWKNTIIAVVATAITAGSYLIGTQVLTTTKESPERIVLPPTEVHDGEGITPPSSGIATPGPANVTAPQEATTNAGTSVTDDQAIAPHQATQSDQEPTASHSSPNAVRRAELPAVDAGTRQETAARTPLRNAVGNRSSSAEAHQEAEIDSQKMNDPAPILSSEDTMKVQVKIVPRK